MKKKIKPPFFEVGRKCTSFLAIRYSEQCKLFFTANLYLLNTNKLSVWKFPLVNNNITWSEVLGFKVLQNKSMVYKSTMSDNRNKIIGFIY